MQIVAVYSFCHQFLSVKMQNPTCVCFIHRQYSLWSCVVVDVFHLFHDDVLDFHLFHDVVDDVLHLFQILVFDVLRLFHNVVDDILHLFHDAVDVLHLFHVHVVVASIIVIKCDPVRYCAENIVSFAWMGYC